MSALRLPIEYRRDGRRKGRRPDAWSPAEEAALRDLAGRLPVPTMAERLSERFCVPRTPDAVRVRAVRLGVSVWAGGLSMREVEAVFGVGHRAIERWWIRPGLLAGTRWAGRGPHAGWWFEPAAVERFVRDCPWAYDWQRLRPGRWRALAEVAHRADPWLPYAEAARLLGFAGVTVNLDRWRALGLVPHRRRLGAGKFGAIVVRARDISGIRAAIAAARVERVAGNNRAASLRMRRARRGPRGRVRAGGAN